MKKITAILLSAALALSLCGCGSSGSDTSTKKKSDKSYSDKSDKGNTEDHDRDDDAPKVSDDPDNDVLTGTGTTDNTRKGVYFLTYAYGEGVLIYNGAVVKGTDLSYDAEKLAESADGTKMLVYDDSELILFDNGKPYTITDELYRSKAQLSDSGAVAYISDNSLYVCSGVGSKSKEIAELDNPDYCNFAISPDGKTLVFSEYTFDDDDYWMENRKYSYLNAWSGNKIIELDDKFAPYCVSNGGKLICGVDANLKFTYLKDLKAGSAEKLKTCSNINPVSADRSKIMFVSDGSTYYFDSGLDNAIKMSSRHFTFLNPIGSTSYPENLNSFYAISDGGIYHYVRSKDSYDSEKITSSVSSAIISADGKTIIYQHNNELIRISVSNPDKEVTIAEDVSEYYYMSFGCDPSLRYVYYLNEDDELRYAHDNKKIASDVDTFWVNENGVCVFLTYDGDLYYSSGGSDKIKITGMSGDVEGLTMYGNFFYAATEDTVYVSTDGKTFKKLFDY